MWKRLKRAGAVLSVAALVMVGAALLLVQTDAFQQWLLHRAESIARGLGYPFSADKLHVNFRKLQFTLEGVVYDDGGNVSVKVGRLFVEIPWNSFRGEIIRITDFEADGISINLRSASAGVSRPSGTGIEVPRIVFDKISIRNGSLTYLDQDTAVGIPSFNLDAQNGRGSLRLGSPITISPDVQLIDPEFTFQMSSDTLDFGSSEWQLDRHDIRVTGSTEGHLRWWPSLALNFGYSTKPFSYATWHDLQSSATVNYENGVTKVMDFRARAAAGTVMGTAEIRNESSNVQVLWNAVNLAPAGLPAVTDGKLQLQWKAADFSNASGTGAVRIDSRQYGHANAEVRVRDGQASLNLTANALDARLRATVVTGLDRKISGRFRATHFKYGTVTLEGLLSGSFQAPSAKATLTASGVTFGGIGPFHASAFASLVSRNVSVRDIQVMLKDSVGSNGSLHIDLNNGKLTGEMPEIRAQLADFAPGTAGSATISALIDGTLRKPTVRISGSSSGLDIQGNHIDGADFQAELDLDGLRLDRLTARENGGVLSASGSYRFDTQAIAGIADLSGFKVVQVPGLSTIASASAVFRGSLSAPAADVKGKLSEVIYRGQDHGDLDLQGTIQGDSASIHVESSKYMATGRGEVRLKEPYSFSASVTTKQSRMSYQQYEVTADGGVQVSGQLKPFDSERFKFENLSLRAAGLDLFVSGSLPEGANAKLTADLARLPVSDVELHGEARAEAMLRGTLKAPQVEGILETSDATIRTSGMTEPAGIQAAIDFTRNEFMIRRIHALFAGATADITGAGSLSGTGQFRFRAEGIRPERIFKDRPLEGLVAVEGEVNLDHPSFDGIHGSAKVTLFDLIINNIAVHQAQPIEIAVRDNVLSIQSFAVDGLDSHASITGAANLRTRALNFKVDARTDLKFLDAFLPGANAEGRIETSVDIQGTPDQPKLDGSINTTGVHLQISEPPMFVTDANVNIELRGDRIRIAGASGTVNAGKFTAAGEASISPAGLGDVAVQLNLTGAQSEYPDGFQSEISSRLSLKGSSSNLELSGNVDVLNGAYNRDVDLTRQVVSRITAPSTGAGVEGPSKPAAIDRIKLDVTVGTPGVVSVSNNLANFDMDGSFRLRGTVGNPIITGRATVAEGGVLYFGPQLAAANAVGLERSDKYVISEGSIELNNPIRTEPSFNFVATRDIQTPDQQYTITLRASGTPDKPKTTLTSDPSLSEPDIVALLLTGRTLKDLQGSELSVAQEQAANYLSGRFGNVLQTAGSSVGLSTVRIDPVLLAGEEDLSARLTISRDITEDFSLIYSQNLSGPRAQTWIASYEPIKNLSIRGINRSDDNTFTVDFRHDLKWGGGTPLGKRAKPKAEGTIGQVTFEGFTIPAKELLHHVSKPGKPFNAYRINEDIRKLQQFLAGRDFLEAKLQFRRIQGDGTVDVRFIVDQGPKVTFTFEGASVPEGIHEDIRQIWIRGRAETSSLRQSEDRLLRYLRDEGYLQAGVESHIGSPRPTERRLVFDLTPGPRFERPEWIFTGMAALDLDLTAGAVLENPKAIQDRIQHDLWAEGYLNASCSEPALAIKGREARFEIAVQRGPRYSIGAVTAEIQPLSAGATQPFSKPEVLSALPSREGTFTEDWLDRSRQIIARKYLEKGFADVQVTPETHVRKVEAAVDVDFKIVEGEQQIVDRIRIEGNRTTDPEYILRQFSFKDGDPVDSTRLNLTRKNLYDTGLFRRVDLNLIKGANGYIAETKLNENPPWHFQYGFAVTDELQTSDRTFGVTAGFSYSNLLGKGITTGTSFKYAPDLHDSRVYASLPTLFGRKATTTAALFRTRDLTIPESISDIWGITLQQQWRLRHSYLLSVDYSYKRNHTYDKNLDPNDPFAFDITIPIARFNGTVTRDTRDDILNATQGVFASNSFEIAPPGVGSSIQFLRDYAQYFGFRRVRPSLVWASGIRAGAAKGFNGQDLIPTEKFHAGGGTTLRGFQQDRLGVPGDALFLINQELRFPLFWRIGAVSFLDAGNVYPSAAAFNPLRLRYSPGAGIRIQTPLLLIRLDTGFNLFQRPGEPRYRFAFGVGQAF